MTYWDDHDEDQTEQVYTKDEVERLLGERVAAVRSATAARSNDFHIASLCQKVYLEDSTPCTCGADEVASAILALPDEQADKWLAEHDRELTKRVLESASAMICLSCDQHEESVLYLGVWKHKIDGMIQHCYAHTIRALGGSE